VGTQEDSTASKLTWCILAVDAAVLLVLFVSLSSSPNAPGGSARGFGGDGTPHGVEAVLWLLLLPLGAAVIAMVYLGVREMVALRRERHAFEHRPMAEQRRLHDAGAVLHGVSSGAPPVADRIASRKHRR